MSLENKILKRKYLLDGEKSWDDLCDRFEREIAKDDKTLAKQVTDLMRAKKFCPAGSQLAGVGNPNTTSLSNCYFIPLTEDSIEGIFDFQKEAARTFSWRGGVGTDISVLRPKGAKVNNAAKYSSGSVSFLPMISTMVLSIGQGQTKDGEIVSRRGACIATIDISHPDVIDFIKCKSDPDEVFGTDVFKKIPNDVSGLNISVKLTDEFMEAVEKDEDFNLVFDGKVYKTIRAKELFDLICEHAWASGDPGCQFWSTVKKYSLTDCFEGYELKGVNPSQPAFAPLLTPEGIKTMGDIKVGDTIWGYKGWVKVVRKVYSGYKPVYKCTTTAGEFVSTEQHKIIQNGEPVEIQYADSIDINIPDIELSDININPQAVIDGLVIGDGGKNHTSGKKVILFIGEDDQDYFNSEIKDYIITEYDNLTKSWFVKTTIQPSELPVTYERCVPDRYFYSDKSTVASFLRGLFSANGSVILNKKFNTVARITLKQSSYKLIKQVQIMLSSLGINSYITTNKPTNIEFRNGTYTCKQSYDLNISTVNAKEKFLKYIGFIQKYKMNKCKKLFSKSKYSHRNFKQTYEIIEREYLGEFDVWDITVDNTTHSYWSGGLHSRNCSEIVMPDYGSCNLAAFNLLAYTLENREFDWAAFEHDIPTATRYMNWVIDHNKHPLPQQNATDKALRKIGLGITGLGDCLAMQGYKYSSSKARIFAQEIIKVLTEEAMRESIELAREGLIAPVLEKIEDREKYVSQPFFDKIDSEVIDDIVTFGMANTGFTTIPPTGSISIILGNVTSGCEPLFEREYYRTSRVTQETHKVIHPPAEKYNIPLDNYETASEIDPIDRVKMQSALQEFTTDSISSTVNLQKSATVEDVKRIYMEAWKLGCKGITIYRDGSKDAQVLTTDNGDKELPNVLAADRHKVYYNKSKTYVNVSKDQDGKPMEVFVSVPSSAGIDEFGEFDSFKYLNTLSLWHLVVRLISLCLRNGVSLSDVLKQIKKSKYTISDLPSILYRVLSKYDSVSKSGKLLCPECNSALVFEGGCRSCRNCGWSKCG